MPESRNDVTVAPLAADDAWALLSDHAGHVQFVADRFTRIRYVTGNVQHLVGTDAADLVGTSMFDLYHDGDLARIGDGFEAALYAGDLVLARHRCRGPRGEVWVESTSRAIMHGDEKLLLVALRREPGNADAAWTWV